MRKIARGLIALAFCAVLSNASVSVAATLYQVNGVQNRATLGTYISCTNTGTVSTQITVQIFDASGAAVGSPGVATVAPQASHFFGTSASPAFGSVDIPGVPGTIATGSAKISATERHLMCTAILADKTSNPPVSMVSLTIVKGTKQRGQ